MVVLECVAHHIGLAPHAGASCLVKESHSAWSLLQDIAGWEAALKHAAGSHKTLVHTVEHYKQLLQESEAKLQQERASHGALQTSLAH